jgi:hypothetical protein
VIVLMVGSRVWFALWNRQSTSRPTMLQTECRLCPSGCPKADSRLCTQVRQRLLPAHGRCGEAAATG